MGDSDRHFRRAKPQRELYKPGSGPLRKTDRLNDDGDCKGNGRDFSSVLRNSSRSNEVNQIAETLKKISLSESHENEINTKERRGKKPDTAIYISRHVADAPGRTQPKVDYSRSEQTRSNVRDNSRTNPSKDEKDRNDGRSSKSNSERKSKKSGRRKGGRRNGEKDESRNEKSIHGSQNDIRSGDHPIDRLVDHSSFNRVNSLGSAPNFPPRQDKPQGRYYEHCNRENDRSTNTKPLMNYGRNGIRTLPVGFESLPPRLKKKALEENGITNLMGNYNTNYTDESWDGGSLTFESYSSEVLHKGWGNCPPPKGRGRGRLRQEPDRFSRSLTPDRAFRSQSPRRYEENAHKGKEPSSRMAEPTPLMELTPRIPESAQRLMEQKLMDCKRDSVVKTSVDEMASGDNKVEKIIDEKSIESGSIDERFPRKSSSSKLWSPSDKSEKVEDKSEEEVPLSSNFVLDWAAEVERCDELDSLDDEPFTFAEPALPPPLKQPPPLYQPHQQHPPSHNQHHNQPGRGRRNRRRSGSRGRNSRKNSFDYGSNNPSRNSSCERGRIDTNWRVRRDSFMDDQGNSRHSSIERGRGEPWTNSLDRRSSERRTGGGGRRRRSSERSGGGGGGGRRRRSSERSRGRRRRSSERSNRGNMECTNWRLEQRSFSKDNDKTGGIIVLPNNNNPPQRHLYNPENPEKPIVVSPSRLAAHEDNSYIYHPTPYPPHFANNMGEQISAGQPLLYKNYLQIPKNNNHRLVSSMEQADGELQFLVSTAAISNWDRITSLRRFLKDSLKELMLKELKFCESENVEQHFWRILYYNIIELLRNFMLEQPDKSEEYRRLLLNIIDEGKDYFEGLITSLESTFNVTFDLVNSSNIHELSGYPNLSVIAAQRIFLFLGDLARYREQVSDSCNYGQARQWYLKANQMNPKNGRPYNQLAILAMYTGRKVDAVYYYMRTLIASSPLPSARDNLVLLFDENRKKYEAEEKKKKEEKAARERERMREKEGSGGGLRREVWVHPGGGRNLHRTTSAPPPHYNSDNEQLYSSPPQELNKKFSTSYLHVVGKIFTKIGLETLNETAVKMLKEFRALLQHSPLQHVNSTRLIQIMSLNMFALEITQPKNKEEVEAGYRATLQESALVISLQMFNLILERFLALVRSEPDPGDSIFPADCNQLLPPIKVWCDWLITHVEVWNPPPSCQDFPVGISGDCWERLASLVNILEKMEKNCNENLEIKCEKGLDLIWLPENATLSNFTPLMANSEEPVYAKKGVNADLAHTCLRVYRLLFFGTVFLCGLDPPVLKLNKLESGRFEYISIVETTSSQELSEGEVIVESESGDGEESEDSGKASGTEEESLPLELKQLIETRHRLEKQLSQQTHKQRLMKEQEVLVEIEIRPKYLVPDTNCFIDYLDLLSSVVKSPSHHPYIIMVPLVVVNELEGLSRGCKPGQNLAHAAHVREGARAALSLLSEKHPCLKPVTTMGHILSATAFTFQEETGQDMKNDDKILTTCLNLSRANSKDDIAESGKRKLYREVVLLTEDRNLRLKALSRDLPVRELQDFVAWAGLG